MKNNKLRLILTTATGLPGVCNHSPGYQLAAHFLQSWFNIILCNFHILEKL